MKHFKHPLCTGVLGAPPGQEDNVDALPIQRGSYEGYACVRSFWKPSDVELRCLNAGAPVALTVLGNTHAPLRVDVPNPDEGFPALPDFQHDEKLLEEMIKYPIFCSALSTYADRTVGYEKALINEEQLQGSLDILHTTIKDIAKTYAMQILRRYGR